MQKNMNKLENIHPGEILQEEFLEPMGVSAYRLSKETFIPQTRISEIIKGRRRITADTALRLSKFFGTSAKFWLGLQDDYDLEEEQLQRKSELDSIKPLEYNAT
jgi:addiction module HigA family antidote